MWDHACTGVAVIPLNLENLYMARAMRIASILVPQEAIENGVRADPKFVKEPAILASHFYPKRGEFTRCRVPVVDNLAGGTSIRAAT